MALQLAALVAVFGVALTLLCFAQLSNIDETARLLRLTALWEETARLLEPGSPSGATIRLPPALVPAYDGPEPRRFFALWSAEGRLLATSSAAALADLTRLGGGPQLGTLETGAPVETERAMHYLSQALERGGAALVLTVGHRAWLGDDLLRDVEGRLLWRTGVVAAILSLGAGALGILVARARAAPVLTFSRQVSQWGPAGVPAWESRGDHPPDLAALSSELGKAALRFERAMETHRRYAAEAAHHLLTPLGILAARLEVDGPLRGAELRADVDRMARTIHQLLGWSRTAQAVRSRQRVDLGAVALQAFADMLPMADAKGKELVIALPETPCFVAGDPAALGEALCNLIHNALGFTSPAGKVEVEVSGDGRVSVADRGPGLPPGDPAALFAPFFTTRKAAGGTGLGLSIVHNVALAHDGFVTAAAREGGGAVFTMALGTAG